MGKSVKSKTYQLHNRIKKEKLQKLADRRMEAIHARCMANLAKHKMENSSDTVMQPLVAPDVEIAKVVIEQETSSSNMMDLVENISEIPTKTQSLKKKKQAATHRGRK